MCRKRINWSQIAVLSLLCFHLSGCGSGKTSGDQLLTDANQTNLDRICTLYFQYQLTHNGQGPPDEATFRSYIGERPAKQLERIGVDPANIDSIFVSDRDNEPFEILWAVVGGERDDPVAIVAEKSGEGGMRMVGFHRKPHREVDEAEYKKLFGK